MKKFLIIMALIAAGLSPSVAAAAPPDQLEYADAIVSRSNEKCAVGVILAAITPKYRDQAKSGEVRFKDGSPPRKMCWIAENGVVYMMDDTGVMNNAAEDAFDPVKPKPKGVPIDKR